MHKRATGNQFQKLKHWLSVLHAFRRAGEIWLRSFLFSSGFWMASVPPLGTAFLSPCPLPHQ